MTKVVDIADLSQAKQLESLSPFGIGQSHGLSSLPSVALLETVRRVCGEIVEKHGVPTSNLSRMSSGDVLAEWELPKGKLEAYFQSSNLVMLYGASNNGHSFLEDSLVYQTDSEMAENIAAAFEAIKNL